MTPISGRCVGRLYFYQPRTRRRRKPSQEHLGELGSRIGRLSVRRILNDLLPAWTYGTEGQLEGASKTPFTKPIILPFLHISAPCPDSFTSPDNPYAHSFRDVKLYERNHGRMSRLWESLAIKPSPVAKLAGPSFRSLDCHPTATGRWTDLPPGVNPTAEPVLGALMPEYDFPGNS